MRTLTIGELRKSLELYPDDWQVIFGCEDLEFYRTKQRGDKLVQIEFNQSFTRNSEGKIVIDNHSGD